MKKQMKKKVTFIQPRELPSIIWDPEKNCPLVEFENWTYRTSNLKIIRKLKEMGYREEGVDRLPSHLHPSSEEEPPEPNLVNDDKEVPPRPAFIPESENQDLATSKSLNKKKRKLRKRES